MRLIVCFAVMEPPPPAQTPALRSDAMQALMQNGAKGAVLSNLVNAGYLKGVYSVGKQYNKDGNWALQCNLCSDKKLITSGDCRTQNPLLHLARVHLESPAITPLVLKEMIKVFTKPEEKAKTKPVLPCSSAIKRPHPSVDIMPELDAQRLKRVLAEWLVSDGIPFNALEGKGFHHMVTFLHPNLEYPGRHTVLKELPLMVSELEIFLRHVLHTSVAVSIQLDFWSASDKVPSY